MPIRGVLFDIDDTLFDYSTSEAAGILAHLRAERLLDRFPDADAARNLWRDVMVRNYTRFLDGELSHSGQQHARVHEFLNHIGRHTDDAAAWFAGYRAHYAAAWTAFDDTVPALNRLAPGYRLGVVSNSSTDHQRRKLDALGLSGYFADAVVCSAEHGAAKPAASIFEAGCAALDLAPHEVGYVGDRYEIDAAGAAEAGLRGYWLDRRRESTDVPVMDGIRVIHSLDALPDALTD